MRSTSSRSVTWPTAVALTLAAAVCHAAVVTPKVKWSQDDTALFVSMQVTCVQDGKVVDVTDTTFAFECDTVSGDHVELAFAFREDINTRAVAPKCTSKGPCVCVCASCCVLAQVVACSGVRLCTCIQRCCL
jgi:hypothetical protein